MQIVADENIPFVREAFSAFGAVASYPASALTPKVVREADVLLVRSVTRVDAALLSGSRVRFVGTATIGTDHIDLPYLASRAIGFSSAPGSNATSVVEWVLASLFHLAVLRDAPLAGKAIAVVGVGEVGKRLVPRLDALGMRVLQVDPPRSRREGGPFIPLYDALRVADIVTLHVPFSREGDDATAHLIGRDALTVLRPGAWVLNASRGGVVDSRALVEAHRAQRLGAIALDVFEGEPVPPLDLLHACTLATPHIAGYSFDGKVAGTRMLAEAFTRWAGCKETWDAAPYLRPLAEDKRSLRDAGDTTIHALHAIAQALYPIAEDDARFRETWTLPDAERAAAFARLRKHYPRRREWHTYNVPEALRPVLAGLSTRSS